MAKILTGGIIMSFENELKKSATNRHLCWITDINGNRRLVEPYMVYTSSRDHRLFHCFQLEGYSMSGAGTGWKNPKVSNFISAEETDMLFKIRDEYNPFNYEMFPRVHFALPDANGSQRI